MPLIRKFIDKIPKGKGRFVVKQLRKKYVRGKILDIGCSNLDYFGDLDVVYLDIKKQKNLKNFILSDLNSLILPFKNEKFDTVFASHVLEHLKAPYIILEECKRVLKKGGILIVGLPNPHYFSDAQKKKDYHINLICQETMKIMLQRIGFKILDLQYNWPIFDNEFFGKFYKYLPLYFKTDYWFIAEKP